MNDDPFESARADEALHPNYSRPRRPAGDGSRTWLILLLGAGIVFMMCCGGGVFLVKFGLDSMAVEVREELRNDPVILERIGDIESLDLDYTASIQNGEEEIWAYEVRGTKGSGRLTVRQITDEDGNEQVLSATLHLPGGEDVEVR